MMVIRKQNKINYQIHPLKSTQLAVSSSEMSMGEQISCDTKNRFLLVAYKNKFQLSFKIFRNNTTKKGNTY